MGKIGNTLGRIVTKKRPKSKSRRNFTLVGRMFKPRK